MEAQQMLGGLYLDWFCDAVELTEFARAGSPLHIVVAIHSSPGLRVSKVTLERWQVIQPSHVAIIFLLPKRRNFDICAKTSWGTDCWSLFSMTVFQTSRIKAVGRRHPLSLCTLYPRWLCSKAQLLQPLLLVALFACASFLGESGCLEVWVVRGSIYLKVASRASLRLFCKFSLPEVMSLHVEVRSGIENGHWSRGIQTVLSPGSSTWMVLWSINWLGISLDWDAQYLCLRHSKPSFAIFKKWMCVSADMIGEAWHCRDRDFTEV